MPSNEAAPIELLGTIYEGGGGLIRDALSYSSLLNKPIHISQIRANRPDVGGLRSEHTVAVKTISRLTGAITDGNTAASRDLIFKPHGDLKADAIPENSNFDITLEGSASIFMIALLPYVLFSKLGVASGIHPTIPDSGINVTIRAGTLCVKAPSFHFLQQVYLPTLRSIGIGQDHIRLSHDYDQGWHTFYVKVPGRIQVSVKPLATPLRHFVLKRRGVLKRIRVTGHAPESEMEQFRDILTREIDGAMLESGRAQGVVVEINVLPSSEPKQYHLLLVAETVDPEAYLGYEQVYPQPVGFPKHLLDSTEQLFTHIARLCLRGLIHELQRGNAVDENMEDVLAVYQSLSDGFSSLTAEENEKLVRDSPELNIPFREPDEKYHLDVKTMHRETAWWVARQVAGVIFKKDKQGRFGCNGIGLGTHKTSNM